MIGPCDHNNESSGSIKGEEFLNHLGDNLLPTKSGSHNVWYERKKHGKITFCLLSNLCRELQSIHGTMVNKKSSFSNKNVV